MLAIHPAAIIERYLSAPFCEGVSHHPAHQARSDDGYSLASKRRALVNEHGVYSQYLIGKSRYRVCGTQSTSLPYL